MAAGASGGRGGLLPFLRLLGQLKVNAAGGGRRARLSGAAGPGGRGEPPGCDWRPAGPGAGAAAGRGGGRPGGRQGWAGVGPELRRG